MRIYKINLNKRCAGLFIYVVGSSDKAVAKIMAQKADTWDSFEFVCIDANVVKGKPYSRGVYAIRN